MAIKTILSTGDSERDAQVLNDLHEERLVNNSSFEEAQEKERKANEDTATGESHNALTETPHIEGQVIAVVQEEDVDKVESKVKVAPVVKESVIPAPFGEV
jgi:hypothetical protein